ncbi:MAG: Gfo/Idh/MocA family oxidoreductase [Oligoflexia bacterium]|nr:Gfo/Idh/MocA family oxidoreductase [Oligoflexia bacterium]
MQTSSQRPAKLKIASIGLGWVTTHRHLPSMEANSKYDIVGVIDREPGKAKAIAEDRGYRQHSECCELDRVPWLDEVDAITVGTSPFSHFELIKSALLLDKHVLTEKPFTLTVAEGEELVRLARERKRVLSVVHNFQFSSSAMKFKADRERGALGQIQSILAVQLGNPSRRLPTWYEELPLGLFYDESPHFFYLLECLSPGPLRFARSDVFPSTKGLVTPASITTHYVCEVPDGRRIPVTMIMNFESTLSEWHLCVQGERAMADLDIFRDIYMRLPNDGLHTTGTVFRTSVATTLQHWGQHFTSGVRHLAGTLRYGNQEVFERFANAVLTGAEPEGIAAENALAVLKRQHEVISNQSRIEPLNP